MHPTSVILSVQAIEASAYEQRQKLLADITNFRDRAEKLQGREELQVMYFLTLIHASISSLWNQNYLLEMLSHYEVTPSN